MLTFEQLKLSLHKWAHHFENEKYEHWELINAVWEMGRVQKLHINLASMRIKFDMIEYMRKEENFKRRKKDEANGVFVPKTASLNFLIAEDVEFIETIEGYRDTYKFHTEDYFDWIIKGFDRREKLVIKLYFIGGFTLAEIGKVVGVTDSRIYQVLINSLKRIRVRLVASDPELRNRGSVESMALRSPSKTKERNRKRLFYNRDYYQKNKKHILANRARKIA